MVGDQRVLTNAHVVQDHSTVTLDSQMGSDQGSVIAADPVLDVALIRSPTRGLPVVAFADARSLRAGQRLLALGYALDLPGEPSTTAGVFSALRTIEGVEYVQTDAPINPGNSGGPLFTQCGELAGINTFALRDREVDIQGLGFAIESNILQSAVRDIAAGVYAPRPTPIPIATPTAPPPPAPPPPRGPSLDPDTATAIARGLFQKLILADPYHPPGTLSCGSPSYHAETGLWFVQCGYLSAGGYVPGFAPDSPAVRARLADPIPYPTGLYSERVVIVDDASATPR